MPYRYKEPETWEELFDALDMATSDALPPICSPFRQAVAALNPPNLSSFLNPSNSEYCAYKSLWMTVVHWWLEHAYTEGRPMRTSTYYLRVSRMPTKRDIDYLRKFLKSLLVKAHTLYGSQQ